MKNIFVKIASLFFLAILLSSSILNLYVYFHHQEKEHCIVDYSTNNENDEENSTCDLCLLTFQLNNLDHYNTPEFSYLNSTTVFTILNGKEIIYKGLFYTQILSNSNRNKAPPYHI